MTQNPRLYPGMICNSTEFFSHNEELKIIQNGVIKDFSEISFCSIQILKEAICSSSEIKSALVEMHPESEMRQIQQFATCRFGGLDFAPDIVDGNLQDGEYWPCEFHGNCKYEGVLCKLPVINSHRLSKEEIVLMQKSTTTLTNEVIAEELNLPLGTFHKIKKILYQKLSIQTKPELVKIAIFFNLIQH